MSDDRIEVVDEDENSITVKRTRRNMSQVFNPVDETVTTTYGSSYSDITKMPKVGKYEGDLVKSGGYTGTNLTSLENDDKDNKLKKKDNNNKSNDDQNK